MIQIYKPTNTDYTKNGDMTLFPTSAGVSVELNGTWEASLSHPIDEDGRWEYIVDEAVVKMPSFNGNQLFRIKQKIKTDSDVTATMEPIFMDAMEDCYLVDVRPTSKNGQQALDLMIAANSKYSAQSNITKVSTAYYQDKNLIEAINSDDENSFVNRWGGEILFDNFKVIINEKIGNDHGVEVRYGRNLPINGIQEEVDFRDVKTRIYPKAYNGYKMTEKGYVDSPLMDSYPIIKVASVTFDDVKMREDTAEDEADDVIICDNQSELNAALTERCEQQYELGLDKPKITLSVDMTLLQNTENYKEYKSLETVSLGDTIHCIHNSLNIKTDARVIGLKYDSLLKIVDSVVLGDFSYNYFDNVSSSINKIDSVVRKDGSIVAEQIAGIINAGKASLRAQKTVAEKQDVRAILFEDLDTSSPTYGAMCLGTVGFEIANKRTADGKDWDWSTFGTANGFTADLITAGTLAAIDIFGVNITGSIIKGTTISGNTISGGTISGSTIKGNTISGGTVSGTTISGSTIKGNTISGGTISGTTISGSTLNSTSDDSTIKISDGKVTITTKSSAPLGTFEVKNQGNDRRAYMTAGSILVEGADDNATEVLPGLTMIRGDTSAGTYIMLNSSGNDIQIVKNGSIVWAASESANYRR